MANPDAQAAAARSAMLKRRLAERYMTHFYPEPTYRGTGYVDGGRQTSTIPNDSGIQRKRTRTSFMRRA